MANHKSAKKRIRQTATRYERNKSQRTRVRTAVKKTLAHASAGEKDAAKEALFSAQKIIAQAAAKGLFHPANASRKISRLTLAVNKVL